MTTLIKSTPRRSRTIDASAPAPEDALDFVLYEHLRHRIMCNALDGLADAERPEPASVASLAEFIRTDLALHIADEEEVFFPLLRKSCLPEDEVEAALQRMNREHVEDRDLAVEVRIFLLTAATEGRAISTIPGAAAALKRFAQNQRRHMMLENAVLIPLARKRLSDDDLAALGMRLAARRRFHPHAAEA